VDPAVVFVPQPAPIPPFALELYKLVREPGEVVENDPTVSFSNVAANIKTAALAEAVVIAVTPEIAVPEPVVKLPGVTSKGELLLTPEKATMEPAAPSAVPPKAKV
jgi:hypothetical protein